MSKQNRPPNITVPKLTGTKTGASTTLASVDVQMQKTVTGNGPSKLVQDGEQQSRSRVGSEQLELLARSMEGAPKLALSLAKSREERERALKKWDRIAYMLNKSGGASKNGRGWLRYWTDLKFKVRRKHAYLLSHRAGSVQLSPFEQRLLRVLTDGDGNMLFPSGMGQKDEDHEPMHTEEVNVSSISEPGPSDTGDSIEPNQSAPSDNQDPIGVDEKKISQLRVESVRFDMQRQKELHELEMAQMKEKHKIEMEILNLKKQKLMEQFSRNRELYISVNRGPQGAGE